MIHLLCEPEAVRFALTAPANQSEKFRLTSLTLISPMAIVLLAGCGLKRESQRVRFDYFARQILLCVF